MRVAICLTRSCKANMGELVMRKVAIEGGMPWEARGWMQLIRSDKLRRASWKSHKPAAYARARPIHQSCLQASWQTV